VGVLAAWREVGRAADASDAPMGVSTTVQRVVGKRGVWPSLRAAISALVPHGASL